MPFLGMRGTGDWVANERPKNWRQGILYRWPNGDAPVTAILSKAKSEVVDDPEFNWWQKQWGRNGGDVSDIYINSSLTTAYLRSTHSATYGIAGATLYVKCALAVAQLFRIGHMVMLLQTTRLSNVCRAKVMNVTENGANSYLTVKLLEADPGTSDTTGITVENAVCLIGNTNPEGGPMPDALALDPTQYYNYTQIWRDSLAITRTASKTRLRTANSYREQKEDALRYHSVNMEMGLMFSTRYEWTGTNNEKERSTGGLLWFGQQYGTVDDYQTTTDIAASTTWLNGGEDWINLRLEDTFRYGSEERLGLCGSTVLTALQQLVKNGATYNIKVMEGSYGIKVVEWVTPHGVVYLKRHPLMSVENNLRRSCIFVNPENMRFRYVDDTMFVKDDTKHGANRLDGKFEEYLTEGGLEYRWPADILVTHGWGLAHA